jgi:hypothetical protein
VTCRALGRLLRNAEMVLVGETSDDAEVVVAVGGAFEPRRVCRRGVTEGAALAVDGDGTGDGDGDGVDENVGGTATLVQPLGLVSGTLDAAAVAPLLPLPPHCATPLLAGSCLAGAGGAAAAGTGGGGAREEGGGIEG